MNKKLQNESLGKGTHTHTVTHSKARWPSADQSLTHREGQGP